MSRYAVVNGTVRALNSTAANAHFLTVYNNTAAPIGLFRIYEWELGPGVTSADNTYAIKIARITLATGAWTASVTPNPLDLKVGASLTLAGEYSTTAPTVGVTLGNAGFHMRGGYRWVSIPGGEYYNNTAVSTGISIVCTYAQGSDTFWGTIFYDE